MTISLTQTFMPSPVGDLTLIGSDNGLRAILWPNDREGRVPLAEEVTTGEHEVLDNAINQLERYFRDGQATFDIPLDLVGTEFQTQVWQALTEIDAGATETYGHLANRLNRPNGARAIGSAVGANPVSIVLPCHRVVGANGALTGFAGGLDAKRWLLGHEEVQGKLEI